MSDRPTLTATIDGLDDFVAKVGSWSSNRLTCVETLEIANDPGRDTTVRITGLYQPARDAPRLIRIRLIFTDVRDLHLRKLGHGRAQVHGFDIQDVRADQLEGIHFKVFDYEADWIWFYCHTISVECIAD